MAFERCRVCGRDVLYSDSVHATVHTGGDEGVVDFYVCSGCYEDELAPLFDPDTAADPSEADAA